MLLNNPPDAGSFRYKTGTTLLVSGLDTSVRKTDIQGAFGDFGHILRIDVEVGKAYVEFDDERDSMDAIKEMDGKKLKNCRIQVARTGTKELNSRTPMHGARGVHTVARANGGGTAGAAKGGGHVIDADTEYGRVASRRSSPSPGNTKATLARGSGGCRRSPPASREPRRRGSPCADQGRSWRKATKSPESRSRKRGRSRKSRSRSPRRNGARRPSPSARRIARGGETSRSRGEAAREKAGRDRSRDRYRTSERSRDRR